MRTFSPSWPHVRRSPRILGTARSSSGATPAIRRHTGHISLPLVEPDNLFLAWYYSTCFPPRNARVVATGAVHVSLVQRIIMSHIFWRRPYSPLHYATPRYTTLHHATPRYTTLHYTTLHYTTLRYIMSGSDCRLSYPTSDAGRERGAGERERSVLVRFFLVVTCGFLHHRES
jgi:hypothetical protein